MALSEKVKEAVERLYAAYGSSSGHLFGIEPDKRHSVEAVVKVVTEDLEAENARLQKQVEMMRKALVSIRDAWSHSGLLDNWLS